MLKWVKMLLVQRDTNLIISTKIMPAMVRPKGKGKKVAFAILGRPANMQSKSSAKKKKADRELLYQETSRMR